MTTTPEAPTVADLFEQITGFIATDFEVDECYTVHDRAGLEALPPGTFITDRDGDPYFIVQTWDDYITSSTKALDPDGDEASLGFIASYAPIIVHNPDRLGEFEAAPEPEPVEDEPLADWERELLEAAGPQVGDIYVITDSGAGDEAWVGKRVEILSGGRSGLCLVRLIDTPRPDGYDSTDFYWGADRLAPYVEPEFVVGQRVEVVDEADHFYTLGTIGVIESFYEFADDVTWAQVRAEGRDCGSQYLNLDQIKAVEEEAPAPKFKAGDRVRVVQSPFASHSLRPGAEGVVTATRRNGIYRVAVEGNDHQADWGFLENELESVVEPTPLLKAGRRLRLTPTSRTFAAPDGTYATVTKDYYGKDTRYNKREVEVEFDDHAGAHGFRQQDGAYGLADFTVVPEVGDRVRVTADGSNDYSGDEYDANVPIGLYFDGDVNPIGLEGVVTDGPNALTYYVGNTYHVEFEELGEGKYARDVQLAVITD